MRYNFILHRKMHSGGVAELADAADLKSASFGSGGSSPPAPTTNFIDIFFSQDRFSITIISSYYKIAI